MLDSTVDDKGVVHYQVLESDKNGRTPDDKMFDVDSPSCIDLIIDMALKNGVDPVQRHRHIIYIYLSIVPF